MSVPFEEEAPQVVPSETKYVKMTKENDKDNLLQNRTLMDFQQNQEEGSLKRAREILNNVEKKRPTLRNEDDDWQEMRREIQDSCRKHEESMKEIQKLREDLREIREQWSNLAMKKWEKVESTAIQHGGVMNTQQNQEEGSLKKTENPTLRTRKIEELERVLKEDTIQQGKQEWTGQGLQKLLQLEDALLQRRHLMNSQQNNDEESLKLTREKLENLETFLEQEFHKIITAIARKKGLEHVMKTSENVGSDSESS